MAITLPTNFSKASLVNSEDIVALVHLYKNATDYYAFSTHVAWVGTVQYISAIKDYSPISEHWKITEDNGVTTSRPSITLKNYSAPLNSTGSYSLERLLADNQFAGKRLKIYEGYVQGASTTDEIRLITLADCLNTFDGLVDDIKFDKSGNIIIIGRAKGNPDIEVAGRKISYAEQLIGEDDYSANIDIPEESDTKYLPIIFGIHWNAPCTCYDKHQEEGDNYSRWAVRDNNWWDAIYNQTILLDHYRNNLNQSGKRILLPQENFLVPFFGINYAGDTTLSSITDADAGDLKAIKINNSITTFLDDILHIEVPMRLRFIEYVADHNISYKDATANIAFICDGDGTIGTHSYQFESTTGAGAGLDPTDRYCHIIWNAALDLARNLCHDSDCVVHPLRQIHIPQVEDDWSVIFLGKFETLQNPTCKYAAYLELKQYRGGIGVAAPSGISHVYRSGNNEALNYDFFSNLYQRNAGGWNELDFTTDSIDTSSWMDENKKTGISPAGNYQATTVQGDLPHMRREAFVDDILKFQITMYGRIMTSEVGAHNFSMEVYDIVPTVFEVVDIPFDDYIYNEMFGIRLSSPDSILSRPTIWTSPYRLYLQVQYMEAIIRAKDAAVNADFDSDQWGDVAEKWGDFFSDKRDFSGFVLNESTKLSGIIAETVDKEPFTIYRDSSGLWRLPFLRKNKTEIEAEETIYECDFNDFTDGSFEMQLTSQDKICCEIKNCQTDYIYFNQDFVQKNHWKLDNADYDYDYWVSDNTEAENRFFLSELIKKNTSTPTCDRVTQSGIAYGCLRTHKNKPPATAANIGIYWAILAGDDSTAWGGTPSAWSSLTEYQGADAENRAIAEFRLNMWANRHRGVKFASEKLQYKKHEIGDVIVFANVPYTLLGQTFKGFNGNTSTKEVAVNGQDFYCYFIITDISKKMNKTSIEVLQLCDLTAYRAVTGAGVSAGV